MNLFGRRVNVFWGKSARIYGHNTELQPPVDSHGIDKQKI